MKQKLDLEKTKSKLQTSVIILLTLSLYASYMGIRHFSYFRIEQQQYW